MRPALLVRAALALAAASLLGGCHFPRGGGVGPAASVGQPASAGGRETRLKLTLKNGLKVVLEENHAAPVVALQAWVAVGAADEPIELGGVAHFFEHVLFKGTADRQGKTGRAAGQIAQEIEAAGGQFNAWTSFDETVYHLVLAAPFFDTGVDILGDALTNPAFDPAEIERQRKVILEEIKQGVDDPARVATRALFAAAFGAHPYARPVIGSEATVGALTRQQLLDFFHRTYVAANLTLVVVGDFNAQAARDKIAAAFAGMPRGTTPASRVQIASQHAPRVSVVDRDVREMHLQLGFHIPAITDRDLPALDLLAAVLGHGDSARLNLDVVRNRQLATETHAYSFSSRDGGLLVLNATLPPARADDATRAMLDEALRLSREEVAPEELARARTVLEADLVYGKETVEGYARKLGYFSAVAGDPDYEDRYFKRLAALSAADLRAVAAKYLRASSLTTAALVPTSALRGRKEALAAITTRLQEVAAGAEVRADRRAARAEQPASIEDVVRIVLPSGMRVLVLRDATVPVVSVEAVWPGGVRFEDARSNGVSTLLAALLVRGTRTRTAEQIMTDVDGMAGSLAGFAGRNSLGLRAEFLARHWERGIELVGDCLRNPSFSDEEIEHQRRVLLDEIRAQDDDVGQLAFRLFHAALWKKHPYRFDPLGTADSVASLTHRKLVEHYRRYYPLSGLTLAIVGDVDTQEVVDKLQAVLGDVPVAAPAAATAAPAAPAVVTPEPVHDEPVEVFRFLTKEQSHLVVGYPGVTFNDPDRFALQVLAQVLAGQGGRLILDLREKQALAYRVNAVSLEGLDPGYFAVYLACSPERLDAAVQGIRAQLAAVVSAGVTADEVARARRHLIGNHAVGLQRKSAIAAALAFDEAYGQGWRAYRDYPDQLGRVTAADVQRVARRVFDGKREVVAVIKPPDESPAVAKAAARATGKPVPAASTSGGRAPAP